MDSVHIVAERVRKIGGVTIKSIGHIGMLQTIEDDNYELAPPEKMIERLLNDNGHMAEMIRGAIFVCDKNPDSTTSNQLQDIPDKTERRKWFLFEILKGEQNTKCLFEADRPKLQMT